MEKLRTKESKTQENKGTFPNFRLLERFTWDCVWPGVVVKQFLCSSRPWTDVLSWAQLSPLGL